MFFVAVTDLSLTLGKDIMIGKFFTLNITISLVPSSKAVGQSVLTSLCL